MAHMVWERPGGSGIVLLAVHTSTPPSEAEWGAWIETLIAVNERFAGELSLTANLVITDGGGPSQSQRGSVNNLVAGSRSAPPVAIVTDSRIVRTLVSGLSIFNPRLRVFPPAQIAVAAAHLGVPRPELGALLREAVSLADKRLGAGSVDTLRAIVEDVGRL